MLCQDDARRVELNCTLQEGMPLLGHVDSESRWNCLKREKTKKTKRQRHDYFEDPGFIRRVASSGSVPRTVTRYSILGESKQKLNNTWRNTISLLTSLQMPVCASPSQRLSGIPPMSVHAPEETPS